MARQKESRGLDYFSLDTEWEKKVKLIQMKFGMVGIGVIVTLYQSIYRENCFTSWDEDAQILFAASAQIELSKLKEIVDYAVEKEVFDARLLAEKGVLTSHGIQDHWFMVVTKAGRKDRTIPEDINLLSGNNGDDESVRSPYADRTLAYADKAKAKAKAKAKVKLSKSERSVEDLDAADETDLAEPEAPNAPLRRFSIVELEKEIRDCSIPLTLSAKDLETVLGNFIAADLLVDELKPYLAYAAERARRQSKGSTPNGYFRNVLVKWVDWIVAFRDERPKPKTRAEPKAPDFPAPTPCDCGSKSFAWDGRDVARCKGCGAIWEYDPEIGWIKTREGESENTA
jgi:hypothetical protein